jgi:methylase of polypeptide subunit release factors
MPRMPTHESLDTLISRKAGEFAEQVRKIAKFADKEEEIRIAVEKQLAFIQKEAGIQLEGKHEFTVAKGRVDSVYSRVLIEYKNPSSPAARIGPRADSPGTKKVVEQIKDRFRGLKDDQNQPPESLFGVGTDGLYFVFVRFRDKKWDVREPVEVTKHTVEQFLWALFNLGRKGKPFQPDYLAADFGAGQNSIALPGVHALYDAIRTTKNPKAQTFFNQWKILFGEVCGYDVDNPSDKMKKLAESYGIVVKGFQPAELLFALHSYYALFMKLLAAEIVSFYPQHPSPLKKLHGAATSNKLKTELEDLEKGSIFRHLGITNFLEGDLFAWYTSVWAEPIEKLVRDMVNRLDDYNPGTLSEDPANSRDLLKKLYQQLFPKSVRHDLGEYYTPDWLAEHVLNEVGYEGDPDKRVLDPACGSGTFLVMTINRIKKWFEDNRPKLSYDDADLAKKILANVVGFDLNPLAVMAARTNYLIALGELAHRVGAVEIPIYLCDSIMTPSEYGGLFAGTSGSRRFKTAATTFIVPTEIAQSREDVAKYAEQLEFGVRNGYKATEFLQRCKDEGLKITEKTLHKDLYEDLVRLDKENRNGVWARIIKNAFAPLFVGKVDYVVGNPPWVNWENLPNEYREQTAGVWDQYQLRQRGAGRAALGKSKHELAALFVYATSDNYLKDAGKLGFVITQSLFKNKGAAGFRAFRLNDRHLRPVTICDYVPCTVFEGAVNRTATLVVSKDAKPFKYPVPYRVYYPRGEPELPETAELNEIGELTVPVEMDALPSIPEDRLSPWLTSPRGTHTALANVLGPAYFRAYEGVNSGGLVGAYWVQRIKDVSDKLALIENMWDAGKIKVEHATQQVE